MFLPHISINSSGKGQPDKTESYPWHQIRQFNYQQHQLMELQLLKLGFHLLCWDVRNQVLQTQAETRERGRNGHTDKEQYDIMRERIQRKTQKNERRLTYSEEKCVSIQWKTQGCLNSKDRPTAHTTWLENNAFSVEKCGLIIWRHILPASKEVRK